MIRHGGEVSPFHEIRSKRIAAGVMVGFWAILHGAPAFAYRPFDGTDAAVADVGEVEIEFQPVGAMHAGSTTKPISDGVLNFGFAERWELVLQATAQAPLEGGGPLSVPDAAFLKYVVQPGVLQDKKGPSMPWSLALCCRRWVARLSVSVGPASSRNDGSGEPSTST